jgi:hypothetical protein
MQGTPCGEIDGISSLCPDLRGPGAAGSLVIATVVVEGKHTGYEAVAPEESISMPVTAFAPGAIASSVKCSATCTRLVRDRIYLTAGEGRGAGRCALQTSGSGREIPQNPRYLPNPVTGITVTLPCRSSRVFPKDADSMPEQQFMSRIPQGTEIPRPNKKEEDVNSSGGETRRIFSAWHGISGFH